LDARTRQAHRAARAPYALAGYAVVAAHCGLRFGILSLDRPFTLDPARLPERAHLLTLLYAGHAAEAAHFPRSARVREGGSARFLALREALAGQTGPLDAADVRRARLAALTILRLPQNRAALEALAGRLAGGQMLGSLTARRIIRPAAAP
jgi:hypothetical protein